MSIDVLQLLTNFAMKNIKYSFDYTSFSQAVQKLAKTQDQTDATYRELALRPDNVLIPKLFILAKTGVITIKTIANSIHTIILPEAFTKTVESEYQRMDEVSDLPFPNDNIFNEEIPKEWVQTIGAHTDLSIFITQEPAAGIYLYRVTFTDGIPPILVLPSMLEDFLLSIAITKIRSYLKQGVNKDFIQQRLYHAFPDKPQQVRTEISNIMVRHTETINMIKLGLGDFIYSFWAYLTSAIRKDVSGRKENRPIDIIAMQAAYIVDVYNNHYKNIAQKSREREAAFKTLNSCIRKPPYLYSIDDITEFRDSQRRPLLGQYTRQELEQKLHELSTSSEEGAMPELIVLPSGQAKGHFIAKEMLMPYLIKAMHEARASVKTKITNEWFIAMSNFETIPSMQTDSAFANEISKRLEAMSPILSSIVATNLPCLVYHEYRNVKEISVELAKYFGDLKPAPPHKLLELDRTKLLADVKIMLPFWFSIPIVSWILAWSKKRNKKKASKKKQAESNIEKDNTKDTGVPSARAHEFSMMAAAAEKSLLPEGKTLDEYLGILINRWNTMIDHNLKKQLVEDVNSLIRDYTRTVLKSMNASSLTIERIEIMAAHIANRPNLARLRNYQAFEEYVKLYIIKLIKR